VLVDVLNHLEADPVDLPPLTTLQYGGSPIAPSVIERVCSRFGEVPHQNYGSTEARGAVTYLPPEDHSPRHVDDTWRQRVGSAGYAMPGAELRVVDGDRRPLGTGAPGEVWVRSESVMDGYWGNEAATREALVDGGWLVTVDVGRIDEDSLYMYIIDRKKDMIISGGENTR
jgi:acyl-CoA synthetase (AMP-forming)/AMP-acid ligase II